MNLARMNQSQQLTSSHRRTGESSNSRRTNKSPQICPNDPKYLHCIRPLDNRKRKNSASKNSDSLRLRSNDSQSQSRRNELHEIYQELISLKSQYRTLKQNYNLLLSQKTAQMQQAAVMTQKLELANSQNQKLKREIEKVRVQKDLIEQELSRSRRQCSKLLEIEEFKNKRLYQNLEEKQNLIKLLKSKLGIEAQQNQGGGEKQNNYKYQSPQHFMFPSIADISLNPDGGCLAETTNNQRFLLTSISSLKKLSANSKSQDSLIFSKQKQPQGRKLQIVVGSPRTGLPNLFIQSSEDEQQCRFIPLEQYQFKKKPNKFIEATTFDNTELPQMVSKQQPLKTRKRSVTAVQCKKNERKAPIQQKASKKTSTYQTNPRAQTDYRRKKSNKKNEKYTEKTFR